MAVLRFFFAKVENESKGLKTNGERYETDEGLLHLKNRVSAVQKDEARQSINASSVSYRYLLALISSRSRLRRAELNQEWWEEQPAPRESTLDNAGISNQLRTSITFPYANDI